MPFFVNDSQVEVVLESEWYEDDYWRLPLGPGDVLEFSLSHDDKVLIEEGYTRTGWHRFRWDDVVYFKGDTRLVVKRMNPPPY